MNKWSLALWWITLLKCFWISSDFHSWLNLEKVKRTWLEQISCRREEIEKRKWSIDQSIDWWRNIFLVCSMETCTQKTGKKGRSLASSLNKYLGQSRISHRAVSYEKSFFTIFLPKNLSFRSFFWKMREEILSLTRCHW